MLKPNFLILFFLFPSLVFATPESVARRIQAHLLIGDPKNGVLEAKKALQTFSDEPLIFEWVVKSLAAAGEDAEMMEVWEQFHEKFGERALDQNLLEEMCWGILKKGRQAPGSVPQLISVIGAALTQDMRAVPFLMEGLRHSCVPIRLISVELASLYGDFPLKQELGRLFQEEKVLEVRLSVIKAIGKLEMDAFLPQLMQIVGSERTGAKEKLAAIEAIALMRESVEKEELEVLIASKRGGLRQLACEVMIHCDLKQHAQLIYPLIFDPQPDVRAAALKTWGIFRRGVTAAIKQIALEDLDPAVGITASWIWLLEEPQEGEQGILKWIDSDRPHVRALAASAIASSGSYGIPLAKRLIRETKDPYVMANLALALISQREDCNYACQILTHLLNCNRERWMMREEGIFRTLERSTLSHNPAIPNFPEVMNQTVRLELLNILAIIEAPDALESIKTFLKRADWKVTGLAAETLLGEGDETAFDLVRELLEDPNQEVRLEAALVLAAWAKDFTAVPTLLEEYPKSDRQLQIKILESLGRIGERTTIPFLIERLKEPSLMLRMIAACVLIQTLNH